MQNQFVESVLHFLLFFVFFLGFCFCMSLVLVFETFNQVKHWNSDLYRSYILPRIFISCIFYQLSYQLVRVWRGGRRVFGSLWDESLDENGPKSSWHNFCLGDSSNETLFDAVESTVRWRIWSIHSMIVVCFSKTPLSLLVLLEFWKLMIERSKLVKPWVLFETLKLFPLIWKRSKYF